MPVVELGESNDRMAEVIGGLREGERVALTPPAAGGATPGFGSRNALQPR
jgi:hypothetical protein